MNDNYHEPEHEFNNLDESLIPFAGREAIFARIQQYLIDPADRHALLIMGRREMGKSGILRQCRYIFEDTVIACYLPLAEMDIVNDTMWLRTVIMATDSAIRESGFTTSRLPTLPENPDEYREWFMNIYLPEATKLIRSHRRFVWLLDDIEYLIQAIEIGRLADDTFAYLYELLKANLQCGIVLTLEEDHEAMIRQLDPLVNLSLLQRLHPLNIEATGQLMERFSLTVNKDAVDTIHKLTDGHPFILQKMGEALQVLRHQTITPTEVKTVTDTVYQDSQVIYQEIWQNTLSQNERLVLTAISGLLYDDPIRNLTTQRIEGWLLETDYPLDTTAINAGIRGLEYRDLVSSSLTEGIRIRADLFQRWLITHARMDGVKPAMAQSRTVDGETSGFSRRGLLLLLVVTLTIVLIVALLQQSNQAPRQTIEATVTLEQ